MWHSAFTFADDKCRVYNQISQQLCEGESIQWNGKTCTAGNTYTKTFTTAAGCDSVAILKIEALKKQHTDTVVALCQGDYFLVGDEQLSNDGDYHFTLTASNGCDSVVDVTIRHWPSFTTVTDTAIFTGETCLWEGETYSTTNTYTKTYKAVQNGCDSVCILHLTVTDKPMIDSTIQATICQGESIDFYGQTLTHTDTYTAKRIGSNADTLVTLILTVNPVKHTTLDTAYLCQGEKITLNGTDYSTAGTFTQNLKTVNGCDSILTVTVVVNTTYNHSFNASILTGQTYEWEGDTYTQTTTETKTLLSSVGCDSVVTMHLLVGDKPIIEVSEQMAICAGETYDFFGTVYTATGSYQWKKEGLDEDTLFTLDLTVYPLVEPTLLVDTITNEAVYEWDGRTYSESGDYTYTYFDMHGCDSMVTLHLTHNKVAISGIQTDISCAAEGNLDIEWSMTGVADQVMILFSEVAHNAGFADTTLASVVPQVTLPFVAKAGHYSATVNLLFRGTAVATDTVAFDLLYPSSVLEQVWNDVIAVLTYNYNGGYHFTAFQWYEDGQLLAGETHSYLNRPLKFGSEYTVLLTDTTGMQMMTCPLIATEQTDISLSPTVLHRRQPLRCRVSEQASLTLYNTVGEVCITRALPPGETCCEVSLIKGIYLAHIRTKETGKTRIIKIVVE
ncbi:MAG: hypothetical protein IJS00_01630 [Paludibacteraceae bacterium]|nr:hypothetical protein [Paludibacteraceae bacterium]